MTDNRAREALLLAAVQDASARLSRRELVDLVQDALVAMVHGGEPLDEVATACERLCARLGLSMAELTRITN